MQHSIILNKKICNEKILGLRMVLHTDEIQFKSLKSIYFEKKIILYKDLFNCMEDIKRKSRKYLKY